MFIESTNKRVVIFIEDIEELKSILDELKENGIIKSKKDVLKIKKIRDLVVSINLFGEFEHTARRKRK